MENPLAKYRPIYAITDKLIDKYYSMGEGKNLIIQFPILGSIEGKCYRHFKNMGSFAMFIKDLLVVFPDLSHPIYQMNEYIPKKADQKIRFDIEGEEFKYKEPLMNALLTSCEKLIGSDIYICSRNRKNKFSYHIILDCFVPDRDQLKYFVNQIREQTYSYVKEIIPKDVFNKMFDLNGSCNSHLRLLFQHKDADSILKKPEWKYSFKNSETGEIKTITFPLYDYECGDELRLITMKYYQYILSTLITIKTSEVSIKKYITIPPKVSEYEEADLSQEHLKILKDNGFEIVDGGEIIKVKKEGKCLICKREHEHIQNYIIINKGRIYLNCFRASRETEEKYFIELIKPVVKLEKYKYTNIYHPFLKGNLFIV